MRNYMRGRTRRTLVPAALGTLAVAGAMAAYTWLWDPGAGASDEKAFGNAVAELQRDPGQVAATVNGSTISAAKLNAYMVLARSSQPFGEQGVAKFTPEAYVQMLVDNEVMYQEARQRGLDPSDADVKALAVQTKQGLQTLMQQDSDLGRSLKEVFSQVEGTPYHVDAYDSSPEMLDAFRRQLATGALRNQVLEGLPVADRNDAQKRSAALDAFLGDARARADIKIFATIP